MPQTRVFRHMSVPFVAACGVTSPTPNALTGQSYDVCEEPAATVAEHRPRICCRM
jgi:hypothetical protein